MLFEKPPNKRLDVLIEEAVVNFYDSLILPGYL